MNTPLTPIEVAAREWVATTPPKDDPLLGDDGYPSEIELQRIATWFDNLMPHTDWWSEMLALADYVKARWQYADMGYWQEIDDRDGARFLRISTGGWSGNEDLVGHLMDTPFGMISFESESRGGHYLFKVRKTTKESDGSQN